VPIQCEYYALEGLGQLLRNVRLVQQNVNPGLRLSGIVMTMFDPRTKLSEQVVEEVRKYFGDLVYRTIIPRTVRLSEAPGFGQPITVYDPRSRGAECYRDLAGEVAAREAPEGPMPVFDEMPNVVVEPVAPPPPVARSAPRPLREAVAEELEVDVIDTVEETPEPEVAEPPTPADALPADGGGATAGLPPDETPEAEPEGAEDAALDAPATVASPEAPDVVTEPEAAVEVQLEQPPANDVAITDTGSAAETRPEDEGREVVVIDAYDLDPDAHSHPQVEGNGVTDEEVDDGQRKRWSLFRRGGKR
jgi:hypothetical protein